MGSLEGAGDWGAQKEGIGGKPHSTAHTTPRTSRRGTMRGQ